MVRYGLLDRSEVAIRQWKRTRRYSHVLPVRMPLKCKSDNSRLLLTRKQGKQVLSRWLITPPLTQRRTSRLDNRIESVFKGNVKEGSRSRKVNGPTKNIGGNESQGSTMEGGFSKTAVRLSLTTFLS